VPCVCIWWHASWSTHDQWYDHFQFLPLPGMTPLRENKATKEVMPAYQCLRNRSFCQLLVTQSAGSEANSSAMALRDQSPTAGSNAVHSCDQTPHSVPPSVLARFAVSASRIKVRADITSRTRAVNTRAVKHLMLVQLERQGPVPFLTQLCVLRCFISNDILK